MNVREAVDSACDVSYPITNKELVESCDVSVEAPDGTTFEMVELVSLEGCPDTFESEDDLRLYLQSALPDNAVGRVGYDDRGSQIEDDPQSF